MECCSYRYRDLGERYMKNTHRRTLRNPWDSFLFGLALTMTRNAKKDSITVIQALKDEWPTVDMARSRCGFIPGEAYRDVGGVKEGETAPAGLPYTPPALSATYGPVDVTRSVCLNSAAKSTRTAAKAEKMNPSWSNLEFALKELAAKGHCSNARDGIRNHFTFRQQKGADMLLLEAGCQVPVMDRWMIRKILRVEEHPEWADVDPEDEVSDKGKRFNSEVARIQSNQKEYLKKRKVIEDEAKACNTPVGVHHVACWLGLIFNDEKKTLGENHRDAEMYLDRLIAITEENK